MQDARIQRNLLTKQALKPIRKMRRYTKVKLFRGMKTSQDSIPKQLAKFCFCQIALSEHSVK